MNEQHHVGLDVSVNETAICVATRHMHAALSARINETDRNDAMRIARRMRGGSFRPVHVKPQLVSNAACS